MINQIEAELLYKKNTRNSIVHESFLSEAVQFKYAPYAKSTVVGVPVAKNYLDYFLIVLKK